jgi:hypothetical protein
MALSWIELVEQLASGEEEPPRDVLADLWIVLGSKFHASAWVGLADVDVTARAVAHATRPDSDALSGASLRFLRNLLAHTSTAEPREEGSSREVESPAEVVAGVRAAMVAAGREQRLVVGTKGLGKSSLILRFLARDLSPDETLSAAAELASHHPDLSNEAPAIVRAVLATLAHRDRLTDEVAGGPRWLVGADDVADAILRQARIAGEAVASIWEHQMYEASAAAVALGAKASNREKVRVYRERSWLLGLPHGRGFVYPSFQFDVIARDVFAEVREANEALGAAADPWGVTSWWISRNDRLASSPLELVGTDRGPAIVKAAQAVLESVG